MVPLTQPLTLRATFRDPRLIDYLSKKWGKTFEIQAGMLPELLNQKPYAALFETNSSHPSFISTVNPRS